MKYLLTLLIALLLVPLDALQAADHATFVNEEAWHYFTAAPEVKRGKGDEPVQVCWSSDFYAVIFDDTDAELLATRGR